MGIEPFLIADTLRGAIAQRLVRRICVACRRKTVPRPELVERLELSQLDQTFYEGGGCEQCGGTGYKGRLGLYEVLGVTPELAGLVGRGEGTGVLRLAAQAQDMRGLREDGLAKASAGETTLEEVYAATARG